MGQNDRCWTAATVASNAIFCKRLRLARRRVPPEDANPYIVSIYIIPRRMKPTGAPTMLNDVYNKRILELAADIPRQGRLPKPDASATAHSKLCGSTVTIDLILRDGKVVDFAHDVKACALGQAASSIMARNIIGSTPEELREVRDAMRRMLKENGAPLGGKWADTAVLEPVREYKARHASTMLTFDAVVDAVGQVEAGADAHA
jgi:NifU-like protein involved in Fe-S cluster formation